MQTQAPAKLKTLDRQLTAAKGALKELRDRLTGTNNRNTGFLSQLKGLDAASAQSGTLRFWKWLIFLAFVFLDILPVVSKLSWLFSAEGRRLHDVVAMADEAKLAVVKAELTHNNEVALDRLNKERAMRIRLNDEMVREAEAVLREKLQADLDAWKADVQAGGAGFGVQP